MWQDLWSLYKPVIERVPYQKQEKENKLKSLSLHPYIPLSFLLKTVLCSPLLLICHFHSLPKCETRLCVLMFLKRLLSQFISISVSTIWKKKKKSKKSVVATVLLSNKVKPDRITFVNLSLFFFSSSPLFRHWKNTAE